MSGDLPSKSDFGGYLFYMQDCRTVVGNEVLWWRHGGGYTTRLGDAAVFALAEAKAQHQNRSTDIPWPKGYIDAKAHAAVDIQDINHDEALSRPKRS